MQIYNYNFSALVIMQIKNIYVLIYHFFKIKY